MRARAPRVVISGIGVVSTSASAAKCFWEHVSRGRSGTRAVTEFDVSTYPLPGRGARAGGHHRRCAAARRANTRTATNRGPIPKRYSRAALLGVIAAREAWNDAGLRVGEPGAGVIIGSGGGGIDVGEAQYRDFFTNGGRHVTPYAIAIGIVGMLSSEVSISLGLRGISHVLSTGCTSSTDALGYAARLIRSGEADVLLSRRRRWLRHAGHDLRLLEHARRLDALQRPAVGSLAALRQGTRRVRARRGRLDACGRARGSRARPRRADLRDGRGLPLDVRRLPPRADGPGRHRNRRGHSTAPSSVRAAPWKRSATSTTTARPRS